MRLLLGGFKAVDSLDNVLSDLAGQLDSTSFRCPTIEAGIGRCEEEGGEVGKVRLT